ncbi:MAG: hypothetical protein H6739_06435 [Alphaproteobacteria bacterium]|nr:hypothetical protein [Alphaproteobacteria bacterium]
MSLLAGVAGAAWREVEGVGRRGRGLTCQASPLQVLGHSLDEGLSQSDLGEVAALDAGHRSIGLVEVNISTSGSGSQLEPRQEQLGSASCGGLGWLLRGPEPALGLVDLEGTNHGAPNEVVWPPLLRAVAHQDSSNAFEDMERNVEKVWRVELSPALASVIQPVPGRLVEGELPAEGPEVEKSWIPLVLGIRSRGGVLPLSGRGTRTSVYPGAHTNRVAVDNLCVPRPWLKAQQGRPPALQGVRRERVQDALEQLLRPRVLPPPPEPGMDRLVEVGVSPVWVRSPDQHPVLQKPRQRLLDGPF